MILIDNWRSAWKLLSIQAAGLAMAFGSLPADQQQALLALAGIGPERVPLIVGAVFIAARLIGQRAATP